MSTYGIRRDGSYYTRVLWCSHTENDPMLWVNNLINDDIDRNGGTWGAHTMGPANVVLDFFGEEQTVSKIALFCNVGVTISILEELAKTVNVYYSNTDDAKKLRTAEDDINAAIELEKTLKPDGYPSMRQDAIAGRPTEVDLFAGTVIEMGRKYGIPTPVNQKYKNNLH
jgi:hypothetical protein